MSDAQLETLFLEIGTIKSCRIIRDKRTKYSYGFGFVEYHNEEDATKAITSLDGLNLENKRIKVAYSGNTRKGILAIENLPTDYGEEELRNQFQQYGEIVNTKVMRSKGSDVSNGRGIVTFQKISDAEKAKTDLKGKILSGGVKPLEIRMKNTLGKMFYFRSKLKYNSEGDFSIDNDNTKQDQKVYTLFVYNIGRQVDATILWQMFAPLGKVKRAHVVYDKETWLSKNYGFVKMENYSDACNAINHMNGGSLDGKELKVEFSKNQNQSEEENLQ
ncbi:hypothetical protein FSP39_025082 [Pinctada imbricata]|uniref:RRM domain-containing protein n=1 Tax=Pinctada imbricata TaxID=66713 RepID=A0AA88YFC7_PINIB|nr:hypothetical protein FSP39_025082 [Pinctada imbricata]